MIKFLKELKRSSIILFILFVMFFAAGFYHITKLNGSNDIKGAISIDNGKYSSSYENNTVFTTGEIVIDNNPVDKETGITTEGYSITKIVEVYQYVLIDDIVSKGYYNYQLENIEGRGGEEYNNPVFPEDLRNEIILADVSFTGGIVLGNDYVASISEEYENVDVKSFSLDELPEFENKYGLTPSSYDGITAYYSGNPASPEIGDIRVTYTYIPKSEISEISAYGVLVDGMLESGEEKYASMAEGIISQDEFYEKMTSDSSSAASGFIFIALICLAISVIIYLRGKGILNFNSKKAASFIIIIAMIFSFSAIGKADFGDYGGDYDYGGYDYDYGDYDYDYGDYDSNDNDVYVYEKTTTTTCYYSYKNYPCDEPYDGGFVYLNCSGTVLDNVNILSTSAGDEFGDSVAGLWLICIIAIIAVAILKRNSGSSYKPNNNTPRPSGAARTDITTLNDIESYNNLDENFSLNQFESDMADLYKKLQNSWQKKDLEDLRPYLTDAFYAQCERQVNNYKRNRQTNIIEDITVENVFVKGYKQDGTNDLIVLELTAKIKDYVIDDNSGNVVRGDKNSFRRMQYEWTVLRTSGMKSGNLFIDNAVCPHCGAPLTMNAASKCEFCDSIITNDAVNWAIKEIRGLAQRSL